VNDESTQLEKQYARLQLLYQVSNVIHSTLEPQEALNLILTESVRLTGATSGYVALINPTNGF
jgi:nitrate/nitrite-specific signal transduction histidine kinase